MNKNLLLEVDSDSCSMKSDSDQIKQTTPLDSCLSENVTTIQKVDVEVQNLEKEDKIRVNTVRTSFYAINERFEQLLKFKPISKLHLWETELNLISSYNIF
jgi:reverse gyrase